MLRNDENGMFDNIGTKIKKIAEYSCKIAIALVILLSLASLFLLISDENLSAFCWIPIVVAIVAPIFIWLNSVVLYAFGELVEKTSDTNEFIRQMDIAQKTPLSELEKSKGRIAVRPTQHNKTTASVDDIQNIECSELIKEEMMQNAAEECIEIRCPHCDETLYVPSTETGTCPWCEKEFVILQPSTDNEKQ